MKRGRLLMAFGLAAAAAVAAPAAAAPAGEAAARRDWSGVVAVTPEGGYRLGNPNAKVKLVEYGSLTCPHCAAFAAAAMPALRAHYVKSGKVSFEYRNLVLNRADLAASLLARCVPPVRFFRIADRFYATQEQWAGRIRGLNEAELDALPVAQQPGRIAELIGLIDLAAGSGLAAPRSRACLADPAGRDRLLAMRAAAFALGVEGTPTFFINRARVEAWDWASLEPLIVSAGG